MPAADTPVHEVRHAAAGVALHAAARAVGIDHNGDRHGHDEPVTRAARDNTAARDDTPARGGQLSDAGPVRTRADRRRPQQRK